MCSNPSCNKLTIGPNKDKSKSISIGVAAHITAAAKGRERYSENMSPTERRSYDNGIWLCYNCSVLIDRDEEKYTAQALKEWKIKTEGKALQEISTFKLW